MEIGVKDEDALEATENGKIMSLNPCGFKTGNSVRRAVGAELKERTCLKLTWVLLRRE